MPVYWKYYSVFKWKLKCMCIVNVKFVNCGLIWLLELAVDEVDALAFLEGNSCFPCVYWQPAMILVYMCPCVDCLLGCNTNDNCSDKSSKYFHKRLLRMMSFQYWGLNELFAARNWFFPLLWPLAFKKQLVLWYKLWKYLLCIRYWLA